MYRKNLKTLDTWKIAVMFLKFEQYGFTIGMNFIFVDFIDV